MHADQIDLVRWTLTGAELVLAVVVARLLLAIALATVARALASSATGAARWCATAAQWMGPRASRSLVATVAGAGLLVAAPSLAHADETGHGVGQLPVLDRVVTSLDAGGEPDALSSWRSDQSDRGEATGVSGPEPATVTVVRGDTLWQIAARELGPEASWTEVALSWPRWHEANRELIGPDPDRLVPGQQLQAPAGG